MKKIGILGGTFDPIHNGHIHLARLAMEQYGLCQVRLMTGGMPPHKRDREITEAKTRYAMTALAVEDESGMVADDFEVLKTEYSYTVKTLTELCEIHSDWEIYFIIGEDSLRDFPKWYKPEIIAQKCILLVYPRSEGSDIESLVKTRRDEYNGDVRIIDGKIKEVSSTDIRFRAKQGLSLEGLVPKKVEEYITERGLYR